MIRLYNPNWGADVCAWDRISRGSGGGQERYESGAQDFHEWKGATQCLSLVHTLAMGRRFSREHMVQTSGDADGYHFTPPFR